MREGWEYKKIGDIATVVSGSTPQTSVEEFWGKGHYWVTPAELDDKTVYVSKTERQITDAALAKVKLQRLPKGTVLLSSRAPIGKVAICDVDILNSLGRGATFKEISKGIVEKVVVPLPPKPTQLSIVSELDKLNELIQIKKEQLKDYDALTQSIFYEMFGDPVVNEKGWEVKKFGDLFKLKSGDGLSSKEFKTGIYPVYGGNGISGYHNSFNMKGCYIIIGRVGVYCGNVRKVDGDFWLTDNAFRLIYKENEQNPFFILYLLNILDLHQYANAAAQPVISNLTLKSINVPLPPLSLQQSFAHKIEQIERQKAEIQKTITDLETLLAARMQYWFD